MADNCSINYSVVPAIDSIIRELEHNNPASCVKLSELINTEEFIKYVKSDEQSKDVTDLESIGNLRKPTLRRLIREYRNSKVFNVANTSKVQSINALYHFESYEAYRVGLQYLIDDLAARDMREPEENKRKADYVKRLQDKVKYFAFKRVIEIANKYGVFKGDIKIKVTNDKGKTVTKYNMQLLNDAIIAIIDNGTDIERNFKDFVRTIFDEKQYWKTAFYSNKLSYLRNKFEESIDIDNKASLLNNEDEDTFEDTENYDDSVVSNDQWSISETPSNFQKLLSERTRNYFNTLPRLASTAKSEEGAWHVDTYNALGIPTYHNYQECSAEIISAMNMFGGFKSKQHFLEVLRTIAENKQEFAAFAKVAEDFEKDDNLFNKVFSDLSGYVFDKLEARVGTRDKVEVGQSNNNNNPVRKLFFNLRNDLKSSALSNDNVSINSTVIDDLMKVYNNLKSRIDKQKKNPNEELARRIAEDENRLVEEIKSIFKIYFPEVPTQVYM